MFDNIGKDLDEEANKRRAASMFLTLTGLGSVVVFVVAAGAYTAAEVLMDDALDMEMVELLPEDQMDDALPPPPPPPPPPPAAAEQEEEVDEPEVDEMVDEIKELQEEVK